MQFLYRCKSSITIFKIHSTFQLLATVHTYWSVQCLPLCPEVTPVVVIPHHMMLPWNGNLFRVTGHLCGEFSGPRWIPHKGQWRGVLMFSFIYAQINGWVNNRKAGDLGHHHVYYDITVMTHPWVQMTTGGHWGNVSHWCMISNHQVLWSNRLLKNPILFHIHWLRDQ